MDLKARAPQIKFAADALRAMTDAELRRWLWWNRPRFSNAQVRALRMILGHDRWARCW